MVKVRVCVTEREGVSVDGRQGVVRVCVCVCMDLFAPLQDSGFLP